MRLRGGLDGSGLRHHLPHGRQLRAGDFYGEEYDCQPYGHDLRRRETELCLEAHLGREHGCAFGNAGHAGQLRGKRGGHYRRQRGPEHSQPLRYRCGGDERDRPPRAAHHDAQALLRG